MAEKPSGERTEAPTARRREDAYNDGQIPRSPELTAAISLLGSAAVLAMIAPVVGRGLMSLVGGTLSIAGTIHIDRATAPVLIRQMGWQALLVVLPMILALTATSLAITTLQARGVFSTKPLMPDFSRINPLNNAKKLFGMQQVIDLLKSLAKLAIVGTAVYGALEVAIPDAMVLAMGPRIGIGAMVLKYAVKLLASAGMSYLLLATGDYVWQWWRHEKDLRMSREEIKQENKSQEGDPMMKSRRRSIARSYARKQMMKDVPKATVVITNPTHIAIAIQYDPAIAPAPVVLAIGQNLVAQRIKEIARDAGVPMVENRPLARALLKTARVGTIIPVELYVAVAEVLAFVFRSRSGNGSGQPRPASLTGSLS
jgi:flagellar biosynthetic protein FlhB